MIKKMIVLSSVFVFSSSFSMLELTDVKQIEKPNFVTAEVSENAKWKLAEELSKTQKGDLEAFEDLSAQVYRNYINYTDGVIFKDYTDGYLASFKLGMYVMQNLVATYSYLYKIALFCIYQGLCNTPKDKLSAFFDTEKTEDLITTVSSAIDALPQE